jgi:TonB-linked SusC/RagA family outer membrane protein
MYRFFILLVSLMLALIAQSYAQYKLIGRVVTQNGDTPLNGASLKVKNLGLAIITNDQGYFSLKTDEAAFSLTASFVGYESKTINVALPKDSIVRIVLKELEDALEEVVISTGYQSIPKERATGAFSTVGESLLNRRVSTDVLRRIEDLVPGLIVNRVGTVPGSQSQISIRGQSTISAKTDPLIVVDNFPFEGSLDNINPNDIESISVLRDAAAASIWGARAGNGVVVITTKKGKASGKPLFSANANITVGNKPDLFYYPQMTSAEVIDMERKLFTDGFYTAREQGTFPTALTPAVELLIQQRDGMISSDELESQLNYLKTIDVRQDVLKYLYRPSLNQQYAVNAKGGTDFHQYILSLGYDRNRDNQLNNGYQRFTFNANNNLKLGNKLRLNLGAYLTGSKQDLNRVVYNSRYNEVLFPPYYPYARLADDQGNPLEVVHGLRDGFKRKAEENGLLDWAFKPLEHIRQANNTLNGFDYRLNGGINYKILNSLSADVMYQFQGNRTTGRDLMGMEHYTTRNLINTYTQISDEGTLSYPIPLGGILDLSQSSMSSHNFRTQLNFDQVLNNKHRVSAITGYEIRDTRTRINYNRYYGYDSEHAFVRPVDYINAYPVYTNPAGRANIPFVDRETEQVDRFVSYYANASYTYDDRYTLSGSARLDMSNLFGVETNQRGVPLYSLGASWNVSNEAFYESSIVPDLKLRATFGFNGNVYKGVSAYTTASYGNYYDYSPSPNVPYGTIINPPNPLLRWERVQIINLGVDFGLLNRRINGSLDLFQKKGMDLIGPKILPPSTGFAQYTGNNASTAGKGFDLVLNSENLKGKLKWSSQLLTSFVRDRVTEYDQYTSGAVLLAREDMPYADRPLYSIHSVAWAGLDPQTGEARGYVNGEISKDYNRMYSMVQPEELIFHGSARPQLFGSFRNTFSYRNISLSVNLTYRMDYYFRKLSVAYGNVLSGIASHADFSKRWQKPGDEQFTDVPVMPNSLREIGLGNAFYTRSEALVARGDHIRLQDVNLSYSFLRKQSSWLPFSSGQLYLYANNLGLIWKGNRFGVDPDYQLTGAPPRNIALGLKIEL